MSGRKVTRLIKYIPTTTEVKASPLYPIDCEPLTHNITVGQYEAIRLVDHLGMHRETAAKEMGIARQTLDMDLKTARKKLAEIIVHGGTLTIGGGNYGIR